MMDPAGNDRWQSKLNLHREARCQRYRKDQHPMVVFPAVTDYNGNILHDWMDFYESYWTRASPANPEELAKASRDDISRFIDSEEQSILHDLQQLWGDSFKAEIKEGQNNLHLSCAALRAKCFEHIANLQARRSRELTKESQERSQRRTDLLANSALSLIVGAAIAIFSVWLANGWSREQLEPYVELSLGQQNQFGLIEIKDNTLRLSITNSGPTNVKDVEIFFDTFHASFGFERITQDYLRSMPTFTAHELRRGQSHRFVFGNDKQFVWANIFKNEANVYRKDPKYKGMLLFCRVHAKYRRAVDMKLFHTTRVFHATPVSLVPWDIAQSKEDFLAGQLR